MSETPEQQQGNGGWQAPNQLAARRVRGVWYHPENGLSQAALAERQTEQPASDTDEGIQIGPEPIAQGAWYRPSHGDEAPQAGLFDQIVENVQQGGIFDPARGDVLRGAEDLGQFDAARSGALQGLQPDLGQFDDSRSGKLAGIGAEAEIEEAPSTYDDSREGELPGIGAAAEIEETPSTYDDSREGELSGIGAEAEIEETPSTYDDSREDELPGIGAAAEIEETPAEDQAAGDVEMAQAEQPIEATQAPSETGAQPVEGRMVQKLKPEFQRAQDRVGELREQYNAGQISRDQLQQELYGAMIQDGNRYWIPGIESGTWYSSDGGAWVAAEPPKVEVFEESAVPTETQMQDVQGGTPIYEEQEAGATNYEDTPLPQKVPVEDPEATLVNQTAYRLEDHTSYAAPTQPGMQMQSEGGYNLEDTVPHDPSAMQQDAYAQVEAPYVAETEGEYQPAEQDGFEQKPYAPRMDGVQPDYSAAFDGHWDRAALQKWGLRAVIFGGVGGLFLALLVVLGMLGFYLSVINQYSDEIDQIGDRAAAFETTIIYDAEGNELAVYNDPQGGQRVSVSLEEISPFLIHATVSTEDETFYENPGFSIYGIIRAIVRNLETGGQGGGASTITQQLTRALVLEADLAAQRTSNRKIQEIIVAAEIARRYSKNEILEFYLNEIYYGNLAYGAEAAAQTYFDVSASELNIGQAALLAGLPQAPALWDPVQNRSAAIARMDEVLRLMTEANGDGCIQMQHAGYDQQPFCVTEAELNDEYSLDIALVQAATFEAPEFDITYPHFVNYVYQRLEDSYDPQTIYGSGFRVYTTIVPSVQEAAQQAVVNEIPITPGANNGAVVAIRPSDGAIIAMVGSADFDNEEIDGQVNVALTPQQPGSSIKPLVYLTSFEGFAENGENVHHYPGTIIWDVPTCYNGYCPTNFSLRTNGPVTARFALGQSLNIPAVKELAFVRPDRFASMLDRLGVRQPDIGPVEAGLPAALGATEVYLFDMVQAYATLANGGVRQQPFSIRRIENVDGDLVFEAPENPEGAQIVRPEHAYMVTDILSDLEVRLSNNLTIPGRSTAAKTGTTNDNRDVWTLGYTPEMAVGVWVGRTDNQPMGSGVLGSNTAAPIWNTTMQAALAGVPAQDFVRPGGIVDVQVCSYTGAAYSEATCPNGQPVNEIAFTGQSVPSADAGFVTTVEVDAFTGLLPNSNCPDTTRLATFVDLDDLTAVEWINSSQPGQEWADARGIETPVSPPPTQNASGPCPTVVISQPTSGQSVGGLIEIRGTVSVPNFESYQFLLANADVNPEEFAPQGQLYTTPAQG
ncbi:MAG: transglycosylase domain-containing protein, partial [Anaerolineales bacterium]